MTIRAFVVLTAYLEILIILLQIKNLSQLIMMAFVAFQRVSYTNRLIIQLT